MGFHDTVPLLTATQRTIDQRIAAIAAAQHGVIALEQLIALGMSAAGVRSRVANGQLHRLHRGVYAVGHPVISREGRWMAAVLACGPRADLSHQTSARLLDLGDFSGGLIHVTTSGGHRPARRRAGITVHTSLTLRECDRTVVDGIPCTNWARTILDLAGTRPRREVEVAMDRAETLGLFDLPTIEAALAAGGKRRGSAVVRSILANYAIGEDVTNSPLEELFRDLCIKRGLPMPRINFGLKVGDRWIEADFYWPDAGLIVEVDGYGSHGTRRGFRADRSRDRNVGMHSDLKVFRYDWGEVKFNPVKVANEVLLMLETLLRPG